MSVIEINDAQLVQRLQQIAEQENRPVEAVIKTMVEHYPVEAPPAPQSTRSTEPQPELSRAELSRTNEGVRRVYEKAYAKARRYWESVGDHEKAALTDDDLHEQFGVFDEEGIPRLKSELTTLEPPVGSMAYAAKIAREANIRVGDSLDVTKADDILNEEFPDYLLRYTRGEDTTES
jgi:hypothetical protein